MSWLTGLAGKAEELLNKVDKTAASALHSTDPEPAGWGKKSGQGPPAVVTPSSQTTRSPFLSQVSWANTPSKSNKNELSAGSPFLSSSISVPANLNKLNSDPQSSYMSQTSGSTYKTKVAINGVSPQPSRKNKRDKDDELFEFLNSPESAENGKPKKEKPRTFAVDGEHSRQSSTSSSTSQKSNKTPAESNVNAVINTGSSVVEMVPSESRDGTEDHDSPDQSAGDPQEDVLGNNDSSSGYHSQNEDSAGAAQALSSLELENKLLKNEVSSLNIEMQEVIHRAKSTMEELSHMKRKYDSQATQLSQSDQITRELQSRESDLQEALSAKDSQLAVLRVRFEQADKDLASKSKVMETLQTERNRILADHTSSTDVQSQALNSIRDKLDEAEKALRMEQEAHRTTRQEAVDRQSRLEQELRSMADSLTNIQRKMTDEKARCSEMSGQTKSSKQQAEIARQELADYKEKAARILQSKDRLISSLKEGVGVSSAESSVSAAEIEEVRQDRDMLKEELQKQKMTVEQLRTELQDLENQMQTDADAGQDEIHSLKEQFNAERTRRVDAEQECAKQKQELRYSHEELVRQKTAFQSRIQDRENEIEKLRNQLTTKNLSNSSQSELEGRLHALTESLIQKQTVLEALSTEKNSLVLQLERMEQRYKEEQAIAIRANATSVAINEDDDTRHGQRGVGFMRELPGDSDVARRVKRAANTIDKFSIRLGIFLRRYPIARIFVIIYMGLLHLWTMVVLLTYQPEVHGSEYNPHPP